MVANFHALLPLYIKVGGAAYAATYLFRGFNIDWCRRYKTWCTVLHLMYKSSVSHTQTTQCSSEELNHLAPLTDNNEGCKCKMEQSHQHCHLLASMMMQPTERLLVFCRADFDFELSIGGRRGNSRKSIFVKFE